MTFQTKVTVDGTDITSYVINYQVVDTVADITPANIIFTNSIINIIKLQEDQEIIITRGTNTPTDYIIFKGNISKITKAQGYNIRVTALDKLWLLSRQTITISYDQNIDTEAGVVSAIASDLIIRGGLTPNVEDSGSATKIDKYIIRSDNILDHLQELADLIDYWIYYDPETDTVQFRSRGFETFETTLQVGVNLISVPQWSYDYTKISNDITLTGDLQEIETDEVYANGVDTLTLSNKPESVKVFGDNILLTGGVTDQDSEFDYSVDKENKIINFASTTSSSGTVSYSFLRPIKVRKKNPESISTYGVHAIHKAIDTIQTTVDAESKIDEILTKFPNPTVTAQAVSIYNIYGGKAGQQVKIIDTVNDENRIVNIRRYVYNYPEIIDKIDVDDEPIYDDYILINAFRKRIERLERRNETQGDLITQILSFYRNYKPRRRFAKLLKAVLSSAGWVWGDLPGGYRSYTQITADGGVWGGDGTQFDTATTQKLIQGDMTYYEDLRDDEFFDSGSTDAVATTSGTSPSTTNISFSTGSVFQTSAIDIGTEINQWKVVLGTTSGTFNIDASNDGKTNWERLTNNTLTSVSDSGTSTYLRITESGTSSGTIQNTVNSYGEVTSPAITMTLIEG